MSFIEQLGDNLRPRFGVTSSSCGQSSNTCSPDHSSRRVPWPSESTQAVDACLVQMSSCTEHLAASVLCLRLEGTFASSFPALAGICKIAGRGFQPCLRHCKTAPSRSIVRRLARLARPWHALLQDTDLLPFPNIAPDSISFL